MKNFDLKKIKISFFVVLLLVGFLPGQLKSLNSDNSDKLGKNILIAMLTKGFSDIFVATVGPFVEGYAIYFFKSPQLIILSSKNDKIKEEEVIIASGAESELNDYIAEVEYGIQKRKNGNHEDGFPNLLLYGPPGTGKTMSALQLVHKLHKENGMKWIMVTGSGFFQEHASVKSVNDIFINEVNKNKKKGTIIIIDEIDSLLNRRKDLNPSSQEYKIVNQVLSITGRKSSNRIIIGTSNYLENFDSAMERRIDNAIEISLPGYEDRVKLVKYFMKKNGLNDLTNEEVDSIAESTEGFSPSDLSQITTKAKIRFISGFSVKESIDKKIEQYAKKKKLFKDKKQNTNFDKLQQLNSKRYGLL